MDVLESRSQATLPASNPGTDDATKCPRHGPPARRVLPAHLDHRAEADDESDAESASDGEGSHCRGGGGRLAGRRGERTPEATNRLFSPRWIRAGLPGD